MTQSDFDTEWFFFRRRHVKPTWVRMMEDVKLKVEAQLAIVNARPHYRVRQNELFYPCGGSDLTYIILAGRYSALIACRKNWVVIKNGSQVEIIEQEWGPK